MAATAPTDIPPRLALPDGVACIETAIGAPGRIVAWLCLPLIAVVVLRYLLAPPHALLVELQWYILAVVVCRGFAETWWRDGNVRIDLLNGGMRPRHAVDLFSALCFALPFAGFMAWYDWPCFTASWRIGEGSLRLSGLPARWAVKLALFAGLLLMAVQTAPVVASGTPGILIPPSIMLLIMAEQMLIPAPDLFAAALLPGLSLAALHGVPIVGIAVLRPDRVPPFRSEAPPLPQWPALRALLVALVAPVALIYAVLGSIVFGLASPDEAAGVGAFGALLPAGLRGSLSLKILREMPHMALLIRRFETRPREMLLAGEIRGTAHSSIGQEAIAVGARRALEPRDLLLTHHRGHGHTLTRGAEPERMFAELPGRATGCCGGLGGSMHIADRSRNILGANGIVSAGTGLGTGAEILLFDFVTLMMHAIVNLAAKARFMPWGAARVPVVFRGPRGAGTRLAAQHAQSLEALFANIPGLEVYAPSTPRAPRA